MSIQRSGEGLENNDSNTLTKTKDTIKNWWSPEKKTRVKITASGGEIHVQQKSNSKLIIKNRIANLRKAAIADDQPNIIDIWSEERFKIVQMMWGQGTRLPGDDKFDRIIFKSHRMSSKTKILDLSVGLGKSARNLVGDHFLRVDAIECNQQILNRCKDLNIDLDVDDYIRFLDCDLRNINLDKMSYDLIYSRERLHLLRHKRSLIVGCLKALKAHGKIIFTDFVITDENFKNDVIADWTEIERHTFFPVTKDYYCNMFSQLRMKYIPPYDISKYYVLQVYSGWLRTKAHFKRFPPTRELLEITILETEIWQSRVDAILAGKMKLMLFQAIR